MLLILLLRHVFVADADIHVIPLKTPHIADYAQKTRFLPDLGAAISKPISYIELDDSVIIRNQSTTLRIKATITAYTSSPDETDDTPTITASGATTRKGVAACPRFIPFDTKVYIAGEEYVCLDRLHPRFDDRFDIWFPNKNAAFEWGIREEEVRVEI